MAHISIIIYKHGQWDQILWERQDVQVAKQWHMITWPKGINDVVYYYYESINTYTIALVCNVVVSAYKCLMIGKRKG